MVLFVAIMSVKLFFCGDLKCSQSGAKKKARAKKEANANAEDQIHPNDAVDIPKRTRC